MTTFPDSRTPEEKEVLDILKALSPKRRQALLHDFMMALFAFRQEQAGLQAPAEGGTQQPAAGTPTARPVLQIVRKGQP